MSANARDQQLDPVEATQHEDSLYRVALRLTRDRARAEDLVQGTYVRALRYQHSFRPGTNMKAWLFAIMRNLFWNGFHGGQRDPVSPDGDGEPALYETLAGKEASPEATVLDQVAHDEVIQAVEGLPEIQREVVLLVDVEELTYRETAAILGVPIGTVMSRLHRARAHLERVIASFELRSLPRLVVGPRQAARRGGRQRGLTESHPPGGTIRVSKPQRKNDTSFADFMTGWSRTLQEYVLPEGFAVIALTNYGERPIPSIRLAQVVGRPVSEVETLARQWAWPPAQVKNGLITVNRERVPSATRRQLQIGDRRFGVTGCAPDVFLYAPLVRPALHVEETCPATGTPIRLVFTPTRVESVYPAEAVVPVPPPREVDRVEGIGTVDCNADATLCAECPFYSSAEAAQAWLAAHPGGRVFPVREAWGLSVHRAWRDRMSALLDLDK